MSLLVADIIMDPGSIIAWLVVGLISGWLAGSVMKGSGYGILGDIMVGLVGSLVGGFLVGAFTNGVVNFWGSIVIAFLGACVFIALFRAITGRSRPVV